MNTDLRILVDLKPVLDGYAGIPQETRLLFCGLLNQGKPFDVEGLLQHGASALHAGSRDGQNLTAPEEIVRQARTVLSFYNGGRKGIPAYLQKVVRQYLEIRALRWQALTGRTVEMGHFAAAHFSDFVWSRCFSKTLEPGDRPTVSAARYRIVSPSRRRLQQVGLAGISKGFAARHVIIDTTGYDCFIAQTPFPGRVSPETAMVVRYHDAMPVLMPHTTRDKGQDMELHLSALRCNVAAGAWFSCISESTRNDLLQLFPEVEDRTVVIPNMLSAEYHAEEPSTATHAVKIIANRAARDGALAVTNDLSERLLAEHARKPLEYLIMVSTLEPRKNHQLLIAAWERLKYTVKPDLKLLLVGEPGWDYDPVVRQATPWIERGELIHLTNVPACELRTLYRHAAATVCPSLAEGFDYSGAEAMASGGAVVASDIAVHREVYRDAAEYFLPWSSEEAARSILCAVEPVRREELQRRGAALVQRYRSTSIMPVWVDFLQNLVRKQVSKNV